MQQVGVDCMTLQDGKSIMVNWNPDRLADFVHAVQ